VVGEANAADVPIEKTGKKPSLTNPKKPAWAQPVGKKQRDEVLEAALQVAGMSSSDVGAMRLAALASEAVWLCPIVPLDWLAVAFHITPDQLPALVRTIKPEVIVIAGHRYVRPPNVAHQIRGFKAITPIFGGGDDE
jgi:hypothetical protein